MRCGSIFDGGGVGKGGIRILFIDGNEVVQTRIDRTVPFTVSTDDLMDVGKDTDAPVAKGVRDPAGSLYGQYRLGAGRYRQGRV